MTKWFWLFEKRWRPRHGGAASRLARKPPIARTPGKRAICPTSRQATIVDSSSVSTSSSAARANGVRHLLRNDNILSTAATSSEKRRSSRLARFVDWTPNPMVLPISASYTLKRSSPSKTSRSRRKSAARTFPARKNGRAGRTVSGGFVSVPATKSFFSLTHCNAQARPKWPAI